MDQHRKLCILDPRKQLHILFANGSWTPGFPCLRKEAAIAILSWTAIAPKPAPPPPALCSHLSLQAFAAGPALQWQKQICAPCRICVCSLMLSVADPMHTQCALSFVRDSYCEYATHCCLVPLLKPETVARCQARTELSLLILPSTSYQGILPEHTASRGNSLNFSVLRRHLHAMSSLRICPIAWAEAQLAHRPVHSREHNAKYTFEFVLGGEVSCLVRGLIVTVRSCMIILCSCSVSACKAHEVLQADAGFSRNRDWECA